MPAQHGQEKQPSASRTRAACNYCQVKKIKCDGARPRCSNCRTRNLKCMQRTPVPTARPTNRRIQQLEEENHRLRELAERRQQVVPQSHDGNGLVQDEPRQVSQQMVFTPTEDQRVQTFGEQVCTPGVVQQSEPTQQPSQTPTISSTKDVLNTTAESPDTGLSSYHGPTSAFFRDASASVPHLSTTSNIAEASHTSTSLKTDYLVALSSKQRQVESLNFSSGLLEFDGLAPSQGMELISLYWSRQLHAGMIVYRPIFMRDMACRGPYFSKLLLNAMYYSVSKHSLCPSIRKDPHDKSTAGWSFRERFNDLLSGEYNRSSITTIQALLIMASSLFTRCDEKSASWLYAGLAYNMIIDLGLHDVSSLPHNLTDEELETRRRVFWAAYLIDKTQCLYQGRHPCLRIADTNMPLQFMDDYEELDPFSSESFCPLGSPPRSIPSYNLSILKKLCELSIIMEQIQSRLYAIRKTDGYQKDHVEEALALDTSLTTWRNSLPPHLGFPHENNKSALLPYHLSMLSLYNVLVILVHRPIVFSQIQEPAVPAPRRTPDEALATCMTAANKITEILQVYESLYEISSATFSLSYATCMSAKFHVNILAKHGNRFGTLPSLMTCLKALEQHQIIYSASRRARSVIMSIITRMDIQLEDGEAQRNGPNRQSSLAYDVLPQNNDASGSTALDVRYEGLQRDEYGSDELGHSNNVVSRQTNGNVVNNQFADWGPSLQFDDAMLQLKNNPEMLQSWHDTLYDFSLDDLYQGAPLTGNGF